MSGFDAVPSQMSGFDAARRAKMYQRSPGTKKRRLSARQAEIGSFEAARRGAAGAGHECFKHKGRTYEQLAGSDVHRKSAKRRYNEGHEKCTPRRRGIAAYDRVAAIDPRAHVKHEAQRHRGKHDGKHHWSKHAPHREVEPELERPAERPPQGGLFADEPADSEKTTESVGSSKSDDWLGEDSAPEYYDDNDDQRKYAVMVQRRELARLQTIESGGMLGRSSLKKIIRHSRPKEV